ncbi:unnamed protein product [Dicrocoelium dendriticum]|nr:unnamed protein product [Dicrocoelium dendriticum]
MTHQSGIHASEYVVSQLTSAQQNDTRVLQVCIDDESLVVTSTAVMRGDWRTDYNELILPMLDDVRPSYILYKLDTVSQFGHDWVLINWVPEGASVRDKMLYASTRATLRKQFGDHLLKEELCGSYEVDVCLSGFDKHIASKDTPAPLTATEEEKIALNEETPGGFYGVCQTIGSILFDFTEEAKAATERLAQGELQYVQLMIDLEKEIITTSICERTIEPHCIAKRTPSDEGRYHLYRFLHHHQGQKLDALFFIHSISGYQGSMKSRILYSGCKSGLLSQLEQRFGLRFAHRLETDNMEEFTTDYLLDLLYPKPKEDKPKFEKPMGPAGRRPRTQLP